MSPSYAELHCLTNFSFLRGASHPEELVERAAQLGYAALAITDECSLAGVVRAHVAAKAHGLKLIVGSEIEIQARGTRREARGAGSHHPAPFGGTPPRAEGEELLALRAEALPSSSRRGGAEGDGVVRLVLLATDRAGYGNLSELITLGRRRSKKGEYRITPEDLDAGVPGCLALLLPGKAPDLPHATWLKARFPGRCWIAAELLYGANDAARLAVLEDFACACGIPLVAAGDVHTHVRTRRALQDTLTAVRSKRPLSECGDVLFPNGERHLRSRERLLRIYPPELLIETIDVAERCTFSLDELRYEYPEEIVPPGETPASWLRKLAQDGFRWRFGAELEDEGERQEARGERAETQSTLHHPGASRHPSLERRGEVLLPSSSRRGGAEGDGVVQPTHPCLDASATRANGWGNHFTASQKVDVAKARALVEHELALIAELHYEPYFLTVYDVVRFARAQGILCQGRGSAANSAVCYCLGVTEVDPARMEMLFERFLSKERNEPPDIDVDFEHERREEVIQYIYQKYGRERAAIAATVISYRSKSAVRDIGKALGLDLAQVDRLAKNLAFGDVTRIRPERILECGFDPDSPVIQRLLALVHVVIGFPRHLSQHVGGFVISRGPVSRLVPVENAVMPERTIIQWDKDDLDALGLLKVDVLALGMLTAIRRALALVSAYRGRPFAMSDVPAEDPGVYEMVGRADTIGVFQIESRAQQAMLPRMRPKCFYDLVIEVAIVRPGPIQGGMIHPYLRRRQGLEPVTYPSDAVRGVLERTLGVPIFQEQVMQLAISAAGFTPGEADKLRRAMAAWKRRGGLEPFEKRLKDGMRERGYTDEFAQQIFQQILGFGEYGFPESHSASFALLVYVSCWLKCYEPAAFTCALLNSQPMGFYAPAQLVQDAQRHGVEVLPPDVLVSEWDCTLEPAQCAGSQARGARREVRGELNHPGASRHPSLERRGEVNLPSSSRRGGAVGAGVVQPDSPLAQPAIRLGLRMVKGLSKEAAERLIAARERMFEPSLDASEASPRASSLVPRASNIAPRASNIVPSASNIAPRASCLAPRACSSFEPLALAATLNRHDVNALAAAGALASITGHRRQAVWDVTGIHERPPVLADTTIDERTPQLAAPSEGDDIVADYASLGLSLGRHPVALLRARLSRLRMVTAAELREMPHGKLTRAAGLVIGRQRPDTASGVIFVTLEDETGMVNVVVWRTVSETQRRELLGSHLLAVHGVIERQGDVVHLVAGRLVDHSHLLGRLLTRSRDFH
jgi:error-prone DNA polymerase